jgi:transcriptional regulator with XRE-family HTH domain
MSIYANIKASCEKSGISINQLEKALGFPRSSIRKWDVNIPSVLKLKVVADYLNTSIDDLVKEGDR